MIFQEPMTSLNPVLTVGRQIGETLRMHQGFRQAGRRGPRHRDADPGRHPGAGRDGCARNIRISSPEACAQRVMIAMALACNPKLLIADEPTTAAGPSRSRRRSCS